MKLNVITGPRGCGKTTQLNTLLEQNHNNTCGKVLCAQDYSVAALVREIQTQAEAGHSVVLIDDCNTHQLHTLKKVGKISGLTIHAAEEAAA